MRGEPTPREGSAARDWYRGQDQHGGQKNGIIQAMKQADIDAVGKYVAEVAKLAKTGNATEHTFRGALATLLDALAPGLKAVNEPKRTECGAPDYIVQDKTGLGVFYVEAKDLGDDDLGGKKRTGHKEQFDRYNTLIPLF